MSYETPVCLLAIFTFAIVMLWTLAKMPRNLRWSQLLTEKWWNRRGVAVSILESMQTAYRHGSQISTKVLADGSMVYTMTWVTLQDEEMLLASGWKRSGWWNYALVVPPKNYRE